MLKHLWGKLVILSSFNRLFESPSGKSITQLPDEIICEIFQFLHEMEFFVLIRVCKSFQRISKDWINRKISYLTNPMKISILSNLENHDSNLNFKKNFKRMFRMKVYESSCRLIMMDETRRGNEFVRLDKDSWDEEVQKIKASCMFCFKDLRNEPTLSNTQEFRSTIVGDWRVGRATFSEYIVNNVESYRISRTFIEWRTLSYRFSSETSFHKHHFFFPFDSVQYMNSNFRGVTSIPILFDVTRPETFKKAIELFWQIKKFFQQREECVEFVLIGNKVDSMSRKVSREEAESFALNEMDGALYFEHYSANIEQGHKIMLYLFLMSYVVLPRLS